MSTQSPDTNRIQRHIMAMLAELEVARGAIILGRLEAGGHPIDTGRFYVNLDDLRNEGYVERVPGARGTNRYRLTADGMKRFS